MVYVKTLKSDDLENSLHTISDPKVTLVMKIISYLIDGHGSSKSTFHSNLDDSDNIHCYTINDSLNASGSLP